MASYKEIARAAISTALVVGIAANSPSTVAAGKPDIKEMEKCYGVVKTGLNDCGAPPAHACASKSTQDSDPNDWIYMPKGYCEKIVGAKTK